MRCPNCGTTYQEARRFCLECGTRLDSGCPSCGAKNPPAARFCGDCGAPLTADAATGPPTHSTAAGPRVGAEVTGGAAQVAERRLVSVLFADLVGFTPFAEERDAEEVRELLGRYFEAAREVVERYGGVVEKFIGDAVMAVWGTPVSHEDDAERAVRAALDVIDAVRGLSHGLEARAGVLSGEAAVSLAATGQGMVAGDLVNTASRLQSAAAPGVVLVGESTMQAASGAVVFEPAGDQVLKGKAAPVPAWRALRVVAERGGRGRVGGLEPPFVGRDTEFRLLKELFHATGREDRSRLVSITGQAGMGKSRLAWELEKYVDGLVEAVWWHHGRSPAYGSGVTFWALGEMVRSRCGLAESDDEATTRAKVSETLVRFVSEASDRGWIEPALLTLLGIGEPPGSAAEHLFPAWRTFFEHIATQGTVAMVFEDLQWADPGLLSFIDHVAGWSQGKPILVVALARPELLEAHPDWGAGQRGFASVALAPLENDAMHELLAGLVPGLPPATATRIVERADGIPLYAVETVRMLLTNGRLVLEDGVCRPAGDLSTLDVPETLRSLVASRLDALEPSDRGLLQAASVLGQVFTPAALAAISGIPEPDLEPRLRALVRREMLAQRADPRAPDRGQWMFAQSLLREVSYATLSRDDRRAHHLAAARHFEALGTDELAGALAAQYEAAWRASRPGPEADALAVQARLALRAAGERALSLGSPEQAQGLFESALSLADEPLERARILERAGLAARNTGDSEAAQGYLEEAVTIQRGRGDLRAAAHATALLADAVIFRSRLEAAAALLGPAVDEYAVLGEDAGLAALISQAARVEMLRQEDLARALALADRGLAMAEKLDLVPIVADLLITRGTALAQLGRDYEALGAIETGRRLAAGHGLAEKEIRALVNCSAPLQAEDPRAALKAAHMALVLARRVGSRPDETMAANNLAEAARVTGDWDLAFDEVTRTEASASGEAALYTGYGLVSLRAERGQDVTEAVAELRSFLERRMAEAEPGFEAGLLDLEAIVALPAGRYGEAARRHLEAARLDSFNATGHSIEAIQAALLAGDPDLTRAALTALETSGSHGAMAKLARRLGEAGMAALEGRTQEAAVGLREVRDAYRKADLARPLALTGLVACRLLGLDHPDVSGALDEARAIFERLGARAWLERLDEIRTRPQGPPSRAAGEARDETSTREDPATSIPSAESA